MTQDKQELTEEQKAAKDALLFGTGFMKDGKRIHPENIYIQLEPGAGKAGSMSGMTDQLALNEIIRAMTLVLDHDHDEVASRLQDAHDHIAARLRGEAAQEGQAVADGWERMTDEARRIQRLYVDSHKGDVYHLMQSLCVRFGKSDERPMFESAAPAPVAGDAVDAEYIEVLTKIRDDFAGLLEDYPAPSVTRDETARELKALEYAVAALAQDRASQAAAPSEPVGVEVKVLARDVHYAIRDAGLAPESPADDAAMRDAILRTLAQKPAAVGVPDGWRLVPVAPTQRMIDAMANNGVKHREWVSDVYAAMLSAAPTPAAEREVR